MLAAYHWPGNVRELQNVIERAVALEQSPVVLPETLPAHVREQAQPGRGPPKPWHRARRRRCRSWGRASTSKRAARSSTATTWRWPWRAPAACR